MRTAVVSRRNLVLAGDGPAVTTVLASLAQALPADRRVVSVGTGIKAPTVAGSDGWIELGLGNDPAGLARAVLAFQAEHLFFADGGGAEAPELLLAAARGQQGLVLCMAARSAAEALGRLRAFSVAAVGSAAFPALVTNTVDLLVLVGTGADGAVRVLEIAEPQAQGETVIPTFVARRSEKNRATTTLDVEGVSSRLASAMAASADGLPGHLVRR